MKEIAIRLGGSVARFFRSIYLKKLRRRYTNENVTIVSNDCIAGFLYSSLGLRFDSPTINLFIPKDDFFLFVNNLEKCLAGKLVEDREQSQSHGCPVGKLLWDGRPIMVVFVHYDCFDRAKASWERRKERVQFDKTCVVVDLTNETFIDEVTAQNLRHIPFPWVCLCKENLGEYVAINFGRHWRPGGLFRFKWNCRRYFDSWDYVSFLNGI